MQFGLTSTEGCPYDAEKHISKEVFPTEHPDKRFRVTNEELWRVLMVLAQSSLHITGLMLH